MNQRLLGVVLCGGRSSRMGQDKAMLPHPSGGTFATHAADRLAKICDQVCISGESVEIAGVSLIEDPVRLPGTGRWDRIRTGLCVRMAGFRPAWSRQWTCLI